MVLGLVRGATIWKCSTFETILYVLLLGDFHVMPHSQNAEVAPSGIRAGKDKHVGPFVASLAVV